MKTQISNLFSSLTDYQGAAALPDLKNYEDMSQLSEHSSPTSNSGGHFAMPMGVSACSMARSSSNNIQQYPTTVSFFKRDARLKAIFF